MGNQKTVIKTIRIPEELYDWIDKLGPRYGKDFTNKLIGLLYIGKERLEYEKTILKESDQLGDNKLREEA